MQHQVQTTAPGWGCTMLVSTPLSQKNQVCNLMFSCYQHGTDGEPHAATGGYFLLRLSWEYESMLTTDTFVWLPFQILLVSRAA